MVKSLRETIKDITFKHLKKNKSQVFGQNLVDVGWVAGTLPKLYEKDGVIELPMADVALVSKTKSAVKSCPLSESSINICLASAKECVTIFDTVKSALDAFSIINPVSAESDAINFSPELNVPTTCVRTSCVPDVNEPKTNPVAPDVLPVILTPPSE